MCGACSSCTACASHTTCASQQTAATSSARSDAATGKVPQVTDVIRVMITTPPSSAVNRRYAAAVCPTSHCGPTLQHAAPGCHGTAGSMHSASLAHFYDVEQAAPLANFTPNGDCADGAQCSPCLVTPFLRTQYSPFANYVTDNDSDTSTKTGSSWLAWSVTSSDRSSVLGFEGADQLPGCRSEPVPQSTSASSLPSTSMQLRRCRSEGRSNGLKGCSTAFSAWFAGAWLEQGLDAEFRLT